MSYDGRDVVNIGDFSRQDFEVLFEKAAFMEILDKDEAAEILKGYVVACLFFEPSTRTSNSFQSAAQKLGASVLTPPFNLKQKELDMTSLQKGESFEDTIAMFDGYTDVIVIRHPEIGSAQKAADVAKNPVINGGDGPNQHPTQTLLDLYTMHKSKGTAENLKLAMVGDLKYGRTVHSMAVALKHFSPAYVALVSPKELKMPEKYVEILKETGAEVVETEKIEDASPDIDFMYVTRIQKERFENPAEYEKLKGVYQIGLDTLKHFNKNVKIMHPLPRVDEIKTEMDKTSNALYFEQAQNGIPVRMALLALVTGN